MTTPSTPITSMPGISASGTAPSKVPGLLAEIGEFWRTFIKAAFDPYHPEQHYMRGPGPACEAKRGIKSRSRRIDSEKDGRSSGGVNS